MLGVVRVTGDFGDLHRQALHVEDFALAAGRRVHQVVFRALGGLVAVPEAIVVCEPVRGDFGGIDHLADAFLGEAGGEAVVCLRDFPGFTRRSLLGGGRKGQEEDEYGEESFHYFRVIFEEETPSPDTETVMVPGPVRRTTAEQRPLNALIFGL